MQAYPVTPQSLTLILAYFASHRIPLLHGWRLPPTHCRQLAKRLGHLAPKLQTVAEHRQLKLHLALLLTSDLLAVVQDAYRRTEQLHHWLRQSTHNQLAQLRQALQHPDHWQAAHALLRTHSATIDSDRFYLDQQLQRQQIAKHDHRSKPIDIHMQPHRWQLNLPPASPSHLLFHLYLLCDWVSDRQLALTPFSLEQATADHMSLATISAFLGQAQGAQLSPAQQTTLQAWQQRSQQFQLQHTLLLQTQHQSQMDQLLARRGLRKHVTRRIGPNIAAVTARMRRPLQRWLAAQHIPLHLPSTSPPTQTSELPAAESYKALCIVNALVKQYQLPHLHPQHALYQLREQLDSAEQDRLEQAAEASLIALQRAITGYTFEPQTTTVEADLLKQIEAALAEDEPIQLYYQGQHDTRPRWRTVEPHWIERRETDQYLHAFCLSAADKRVFRLDRILQIAMP